MKILTPEDAVPLTVLKDAYGEEVALEDPSGESEPMQILAEFRVEAKQYAVLQSAAMKRDEELALFHIITDEQGELQLETVQDDEEWETILELYDEMTVNFD
jgi:uncharacterized protein YrzB (UPF0473 family)